MTAARQTTSEILQQLLSDLPEDTVSVRFIVGELRHRSYGGLLIVLGLIGLIPGIAVFAGILLIVPGVHMLLGFESPRLPRIVSSRSISSNDLKRLGDRALPHLAPLERYIKPRWAALSRPPISNLLGALVVCLALTIMVPLPFSNMPPAVSLVLLALGLLERDGLFIVLGCVVGLSALVIGVGVVTMAVKSLQLVFS